VVVVGEGEALGEQRACPVSDRLDLHRGEQVVEARTEGATVELGQHSAHIVGTGRRHALAGEVPNDGTELPRRVKGESVVDADHDLVHLVAEAVAAFSVGVVGKHVEPGELAEAVLMIVEQREVVLVG
jgi:hypothetical protein